MRIPSLFPAVLALATALLAACGTTLPSLPEPAPAPPVAAPGVLTVAESFVSAEFPEEELDSLATWTGEDGRVLLIATAKSTHRLVVFDAETGRRLREFGSEGTAPGLFSRPNGVAVYGDQLFVVERDNHRVQVFGLPDFTPLGSFGEAQLRSPYGIWLHEPEPGELDVYITDSYMHGPKSNVVPPPAELGERVRRFRVRTDLDGRLRATYGGAFGDTTPESALRMVESIAGDLANDRLLIADEDSTRKASTLREYTFSGRYTGRSLPQDSFGAEAEGVALWSCPDGSGYWITVDQLAPLTIFHVFDRVTLQPRGSFSGQATAHTDGIALHAAAMQAFPAGALFAVHDDKSVAAFDLRDVAQALALQPACLE